MLFACWRNQKTLHGAQAALRHRLDQREAALAPVRAAFRLAGGAAAGARGTLDEPQFAAFCRLVNPAVTRGEVAALLAAMAPGGARQVRATARQSACNEESCKGGCAAGQRLRPPVRDRCEQCRAW